jgi:hypothetical protein
MYNVMVGSCPQSWAALHKLIYNNIYFLRRVRHSKDNIPKESIKLTQIIGKQQKSLIGKNILNFEGKIILNLMEKTS